MIMEKNKINRIMVIDDEEFCQTMMKTYLFKAGIDVDSRVDSCIQGLEALETI